MFTLTCFADEYNKPSASHHKTHEPNKSTSPPKECPEAGASFLSQLTFWWANAFFLYGYKNTITENDLWALAEEDTAEVVSKQLEVNWKKEFTGKDGKVGEKWKKMTEEEAEEGDNSEGGEKKSSSDNWRVDARFLFAVWKVLVRTFGRLYLLQTVFSLASTLISFTHPQLLK